ncbi:MAG: DUF4124 domain-containing protein [Rhodanobacteraceae bacterium]|nr:MAG: DUF4124 domain-containing protein [Rhodanobacteraceae bacterium]
MPRRGSLRGSGSVIRVASPSLGVSLAHAPNRRLPLVAYVTAFRKRIGCCGILAPPFQALWGSSMQMRTMLVASVIGFSLACAAGLASAQQIYKWKDASGVTHFSQTPPASGMHYSKMRLANEPEVSSNPPPSSTPAPEAGGGGNTTPQQPASAGTQANTPSNRAALCKQLSSNISLLQGKQPVVTAGGNGQQQVMSDNAREQQLATARAQQAQYCSSKGG